MSSPHKQPSSASIATPPSPHKPERDKESIAHLQDSVPQLESLFNITRCIGHGTFSSVYLASIKHTTTINGRRHFAIKHIIPTSHPSRVYMELKCLKTIGGVDNVMGITMCFRQLNHIVLVMPHFPHDNFSDYVGQLSTQELRDYLINLLVALRRVHSFRVIHRDVKPANFLYNRWHRRYSLVDFGLAQEIGQVRDGSSRSSVSGKASPAVMNTPLTTTSKTVKRKLSICTGEDEFIKRMCQQATPSPGVTGILSSTTSRLNTSLRRSPRKKMVSHISPKKENFEASGREAAVHVTPRKVATSTHTPENLQTTGSPSKRTHSVEASGRRLEPSCVGAQRSLSGTLQLRLEVTQGLRRSPRKLPSVTSQRNMYLEKLTKDDSALQVGNVRQQGMGVGISGNTLVTCLAPQHSAPVTPRVSGLSFTPDMNRDTARTQKNKKVLHEVQTRSGSVLRPVSCHCYGAGKVCGLCLTRGNQVAPRAGTPGFRAPEVLLRHPDQDTGVDMWSVGVVLLSLLSGRYPFFRAADDLSNLSEITTLLGTAAVRRAAAKMGKLLKCSEEKHPLDLMKVCEILRNNNGGTTQEAVGEQCQGCRQHGVCVCLTPPDSCSPRGSLKKRMPSQKPQLSRKDTTPITTPFITSTPTTATPTTTILSTAAIPTTAAMTPDRSPLSADVSTSPMKDTLVPLLSSGVSEKEGVGSEGDCPTLSYPPQLYQLLMRLLDPSPEARITAEEALAHPFLTSTSTT